MPYSKSCYFISVLHSRKSIWMPHLVLVFHREKKGRRKRKK